MQYIYINIHLHYTYIFMYIIFYMHLCFTFKIYLIFDWSITALQCCVIFVHFNILGWPKVSLGFFCNMFW